MPKIPLTDTAPLGHILIMQTVAETTHYAQRAAKLLSLAERDAVIAAVAADPLAGDLIQGTGGLRKLRFGKGGRGKSGGVRVIYYYYDDKHPLTLMALFAKNEKDNLSKAERNALAEVVVAIKRSWRLRSLS